LNACRDHGSVKINCFLLIFPLHLLTLFSHCIYKTHTHSLVSYSSTTVHAQCTLYELALLKKTVPTLFQCLPKNPSSLLFSSLLSLFLSSSLPPSLPLHYGYLKLVQHDFISFQVLAEKTKLQNQSHRRSG